MGDIRADSAWRALFASSKLVYGNFQIFKKEQDVISRTVPPPCEHVKFVPRLGDGVTNRIGGPPFFSTGYRKERAPKNDVACLLPIAHHAQNIQAMHTVQWYSLHAHDSNQSFGGLFAQSLSYKRISSAQKAPRALQSVINTVSPSVEVLNLTEYDRVDRSFEMGPICGDDFYPTVKKVVRPCVNVNTLSISIDMAIMIASKATSNRLPPLLHRLHTRSELDTDTFETYSDPLRM